MPEFGVSTGEDCRGFFGEFDVPSFGEHAENGESAASTKPAFGDFFEVLDTVNDVSFRVFLWQIQ